MRPSLLIEALGGSNHAPIRSLFGGGSRGSKTLRFFIGFGHQPTRTSNTKQYTIHRFSLFNNFFEFVQNFPAPLIGFERRNTTTRHRNFCTYDHLNVWERFERLREMKTSTGWKLDFFRTHSLGLMSFESYSVSDNTISILSRIKYIHCFDAKGKSKHIKTLRIFASPSSEPMMTPAT